MSTGFQNKLRDGIMQKLKPKEKEIAERIRSALRGQPIEEVLRRFAGNGNGYITEEDLIIGVSKLNSNLYLGDLKEFINAIKNATNANQDNKIPLGDTL